ncbi:unnamed protein product [Cercopithifilaria johnstoni]|uniref:DNA repair metallo-beta-lactamase domain-containing protein n=1 Tax=Cercopithifilaria johnstoni TaxID=2874296 RepID=A0A8J2Q3H4_9BILA|nr:unnamed protein product [Cercopithifilaria johnstoni]
MILSTGRAGLVIDSFIAIDQFDTNPDVKYFFLSSAHSRHCRKLTSKCQSDGIYCSPTTAKLLPLINSRRKRYNIPDEWIRPLDLNVWHEMGGFQVMLIDANHAPGAVMLIIQGDHCSTLGRILYTGFFRADARFYQNVMGLSVLQEKKFDIICIDSTYVDFAGEFPSRRSSAKEAANLLRLLKYNGVGSVAIPVPIIGRESFLVNISRELKCKIWLHPERFEIAHILGINDYFSNTKEDTYIWTCSEIEGQQVLSTTDSHVIKASITPYVMPNIPLNNEREHLIRYSDHSSSAELQSFLSLLSFSHVVSTPNKLPPLIEDELKNLSLSGMKTVHYCKEEHESSEELLFDPFRTSWRIGIAFDYALRKFYDQLSAIENSLHLLSDQNMGEMLPEASHVDNFIGEQHLKMNIPGIDKSVNVPDTRDSNSITYPFKKFFTNFISVILRNDDKSDTEGEEDRLDEMAILDVKHTEDDSQEVENFLQDTCESAGSKISVTKMATGILEEQYDVSVLLDYFTNAFYTEDFNFGSTEDAEFLELLSNMDISKFFNSFDDLFEKYRESVGKTSVGIINQPYHVEEHICYDASNGPMLPDVVHELLHNPILELHQRIIILNCSILKNFLKNRN